MWASLGAGDGGCYTDSKLPSHLIEAKLCARRDVEAEEEGVAPHCVRRDGGRVHGGAHDTHGALLRQRT